MEAVSGGSVKGMRSILEGLPIPHKQYSLVGESQDNSRDFVDPARSRHIEDAADAEVRQQQTQHARCVSASSCRSQAMQRRMPRPRPADMSLKPSATTSTYSLQVAEAAMVSACDALISHDAVRYKPCGKTAAKRRKQEETLLQAGPSSFEAQYDACAIQNAADVLRVESELLLHKYGHSKVPLREVTDLLRVTGIDHQCAPLLLLCS